MTEATEPTEVIEMTEVTSKSKHNKRGHKNFLDWMGVFQPTVLLLRGSQGIEESSGLRHQSRLQLMHPNFVYTYLES